MLDINEKFVAEWLSDSKNSPLALFYGPDAYFSGLDTLSIGLIVCLMMVMVGVWLGTFITSIANAILWRGTGHILRAVYLFLGSIIIAFAALITYGFTHQVAFYMSLGLAAMSLGLAVAAAIIFAVGRTYIVSNRMNQNLYCSTSSIEITKLMGPTMVYPFVQSVLAENIENAAALKNSNTFPFQNVDALVSKDQAINLAKLHDNRVELLPAPQ